LVVLLTGESAMIRLLVIVSLMTATALAAAEGAERAALRAQVAEAASEAAKVSRAFNLVHQYAAASVVSIHTREQYRMLNRAERRIEEREVPVGEGSGFIARSTAQATWVVTNAHVVVQTNTEREFVRGSTGQPVTYDRIGVGLHDGRMIDAELAGIDVQSDLAVLKIAVGDLTPVEWDDSDKVMVGDFVLALGYPFGTGYSATSGIVSATDRSTGIYSGVRGFESFIQTDAAINPGNSGGPLLNLRGQVIGVNANIISPTGVNAGLGFAIPSNLAQRVAEDLMDNGKVSRPMVGVAIDPDFTAIEAATQGVPNNHAVRIQSVVPESPAEQGGVKTGDVILTINGLSIQGTQQFRAKIASVRPGDTLDIQVWRGGKIERVQVKPVAAEQLEAKAGQQVKQGAMLGGFGMLLGADDKPGLVIIHVERDSLADQAGLEPGDRVLHERSSGELSALADLSALSNKREVVLQVLKDGRAVWIRLRR